MAYKRIEVPSPCVIIGNDQEGVIINQVRQEGLIINKIGKKSGAFIYISRHTPSSAKRLIHLNGSEDQVAKAEEMINDLIHNAGEGASLIKEILIKQISIKMSKKKANIVIGEEEGTLKGIQARSGTLIKVVPCNMSEDALIHIVGTDRKISHAKDLVEYAASEKRQKQPRDPLLPDPDPEYIIEYPRTNPYYSFLYNMNQSVMTGNSDSTLLRHGGSQAGPSCSGLMHGGPSNAPHFG